jgi:hypothetical protein
MTVDKPKPTDGAERAAQASLAQTERRFLRLTFWQTVLSVVGVFIAVVALYAALDESAAVRRQTAAAVWPYVQFSIEDFDRDEAAQFAISMTNVGVGPAKIGSVKIVFDGEAVSTWREAMDRILDDSVGRSFISNRVLSPGEKVEILKTTDRALVRRLQAAVATPATYLSYCYCSIFDECWLVDSRSDRKTPDEVEVCPDFGESAFLD